MWSHHYCGGSIDESDNAINQIPLQGIEHTGLDAA
jgi:hypothetical protein